MRAIVWDDDSAGDRAVSAYMDTLTKETGTLHRVLSKHMPEGTVLGIMEPVFGSYREQLGKAFREAPVTTERGKERFVCLDTFTVYLLHC
jgi:vacuolar protein sorting-associated protein 54